MHTDPLSRNLLSKVEYLKSFGGKRWKTVVLGENTFSPKTYGTTLIPVNFKLSNSTNSHLLSIGRQKVGI